MMSNQFSSTWTLQMVGFDTTFSCTVPEYTPGQAFIFQKDYDNWITFEKTTVVPCTRTFEPGSQVNGVAASDGLPECDGGTHGHTVINDMDCYGITLDYNDKQSKRVWIIIAPLGVVEFSLYAVKRDVIVKISSDSLVPVIGGLRKAVLSNPLKVVPAKDEEINVSVVLDDVSIGNVTITADDYRYIDVYPGGDCGTYELANIAVGNIVAIYLYEIAATYQRVEEVVVAPIVSISSRNLIIETTNGEEVDVTKLRLVMTDKDFKAGQIRIINVDGVMLCGDRVNVVDQGKRDSDHFVSCVDTINKIEWEWPSVEIEGVRQTVELSFTAVHRL